MSRFFLAYTIAREQGHCRPASIAIAALEPFMESLCRLIFN
jgi:hypothetical protein